MHSRAALAALLALLVSSAPPARASAPDPGAPAGTKRTPPAAVPDDGPFPYPADAARSTPGTRLRLVETGRLRTPGTVEVDYHLEGGGFPRGKVYRLYQLALDGAPEALCGALVADSTGALVPDAAAAVHETSLCPEFAGIELGAYEYMPGEPYRVAVVSLDESVKVVATAFPHPIEGRDGAHRLLLEMTSPDRRSFTLWGAGFPPNANLRTKLTAGADAFEGAAFADEHGVLRLQLNAPPGAPGGTVTYEVIGPAGRPKVTYRWGEAR